jgi:hypothetical protein
MVRARLKNAPQIAQRFVAVTAILLFLVSPSEVSAYSVLAHEAIIDSAWEMNIRPLLLKRFPKATEEELRKAHGYAYGGSIIQDLGYYPHGSRYFSDLVHYVRSGDFVQELLRDAKDINEYAFALGALAHYAADEYGHRVGVNRSVPLLYPELERKYGDFITYEDNPAAHLKTEFGFDVLQVAKNRYAPDSYHDFIGFEVAKPLLECAFQETYSRPLAPVFGDLDGAIGSYRYAVHSAIPKATRVAWVLKKKDIQRDTPGITKKKFLYNLSRASYRKEWGKDYRAPGFGVKFLAFIIALVPKIGPLKALSLRTPTPQAESLFMASFNDALDDYKRLLEQERNGRLNLPNINFDTGAPAKPGVYFMTDDAYAHLLDDLAAEHFKSVSDRMRSDILAFYQNDSAPIATKKDPKAWQRLQQELGELKSAGPRQLSSSNAPASDSSDTAGLPEAQDPGSSPQ